MHQRFRVLRRLVSILAISATVVMPFSPMTALPAYAAGLFSDGFESGNFSSWTSVDTPKWDVTATVAHSGVRKAVVKGNTSGVNVLRKDVATTGYENIVLSYWYFIADDLEVGDFVGVQWFDGSGWNTVAVITNANNDDPAAWHLTSLSLPVAAADSASFRFRFVASLDAGSDVVRIDDVSLTGDVLATPTPEPTGTPEPTPPIPCPPGFIGFVPDCIPDVPPVCPPGTIGAPPVCIPIPECPPGTVGVFPACAPIPTGSPTPTPEPCGGEEQQPCESPSPTPDPEDNDGGGSSTPSEATLIIQKVILNGEDASVSFSDFSFWLDGDLYQFEEDGTNEIVIDSGEYKVTEDLTPSYTVGYSDDCDENGNVAMLAGESYHCIVTNTVGVGGFNPGSEVPAPTLLPTPSIPPRDDTGGSESANNTGGSTLAGNGQQSPTPSPEPGPASGSDETIASGSLAAAIGSLADWPVCLPGGIGWIVVNLGLYLLAFLWLQRGDWKKALVALAIMAAALTWLAGECTNTPSWLPSSLSIVSLLWIRLRSRGEN